MPSITSITQISISSGHDLDCSPAIDAWHRADHKPGSIGFKCEGPQHPKGHALELGLGIGLGVPGLLVLCYCIYLFKKKIDRDLLMMKKYKDTPPAYYMGNRPPIYAPEGGVESNHGSVTMIAHTGTSGGHSVQEEQDGHRPPAYT